VPQLGHCAQGLSIGVDSAIVSRSRASKASAASDQDLIASCLGGDQNAWETLVVKYQRLIYSIPVSYRLPHQEADEVFQRVSLKLFENLAKLRKVESLPSWIGVTTRRECQALRRGSQRYTVIDEVGPNEPAEDPPDVAEELHQVECEHALAVALGQMDGTCRELLTYLFLEEPPLSYQEISARMGRPVGSLGPTKSRCLKKLKTIYSRVGGEDR